MVSKKITVNNETGIHARPASTFVKTASSFKSNIYVVKGEKKAVAKSILNVLALGISQGEEIELEVSGEDEQEALDALVDLINSGFGE